MKNSNLNNEYLDDEIDLLELLRTLYSSKKLIIIVTLAFSLLAFIYTTQKEAEYQSTVILEIGSYDLINGEKKLVEPVSSLIKKLKVNLIYKKQLGLDAKKLNYKSIEDYFLEINYTSPSPEFNENLINEAIKFSQDSHAEILSKIANSFSEKIVTIDSEIELLKNSLENQIELLKNSLENQIELLNNSIESQQESQKLNAINAIKVIDNKIPAIEAKIKYLLKLIPEEENNLLLLESDSNLYLKRASSSPTLQQVIYSYNAEVISLKYQIQDLQQEKEALEMQVKSIAEGKSTSEELFKLQQEKDTLEMQVKYIAEGKSTSEELFKLQQEKDTLELQVKLVKDQKSRTQPIRELVTSEIKTQTLSIILVGAVLGFILSIFIVFIRQAFLKEQH
jgi:LPS O-antigen subunit length determinant protein (WzzB/FepE family)